MKKFALIALAASAAAIAMPAAAQNVTGTVNITGFVNSKCLVQPDGGGTFGTNVALGNLAQANGTMATDLSSRFTTIGGSALQFKVVCTTNDPKITVDADPIASATIVSAGYDNSIDFDADVTVARVAGSLVYSNDSNNAASGPTALGSPLANIATNITVATSDYHTDNPTDILVAGTDYAGKITITIAPN